MAVGEQMAVEARSIGQAPGVRDRADARHVRGAPILGHEARRPTNFETSFRGAAGTRGSARRWHRQVARRWPDGDVSMSKGSPAGALSDGAHETVDLGLAGVVVDAG